MKRNRKIKILATLGPASNDVETIESLVKAGADAFRINMSHASHDLLKQTYNRIREVEKKLEHTISVLCDLQGPKLRIAQFTHGAIQLKHGDTFTLDNDDTPGSQTRVYLPHPEIFVSAQIGDRILLDDGKVEIKCIERDEGKIICDVIHGGTLSDRKGISLPDTLLKGGTLTDKDCADLKAALNIGADWIALSFVQRPQDVEEVKRIANGRAAILSKIEKPQAIECLEEIVDISDAIMIARGDLGVEMPVQQVPGLQKRMIKLARQAGKPVVVATQMLESMISSPVPTRAEVSDVAQAVFEGADAVMLSAESAAGQYPALSVQTMNKIAEEVETDEQYQTILKSIEHTPERSVQDAISQAARQTARTAKLKAIVTFTSSGSTALRAARERPSRPILALSPELKTARKLGLVWGVHCITTADLHSIEDMVKTACVAAHEANYAQEQDSVIITAGVPFGQSGTTNLIWIAKLADNL